MCKSRLSHIFLMRPEQYQHIANALQEPTGSVGLRPNPLIYVCVSNICLRKVVLSKHVKIAQTVEPTSVVHAIDIDDRKSFSTRTPVKGTYINFEAPDGTDFCQVILQEDRSARDYKAADSQKFQISSYNAINETSLLVFQDRDEEHKRSDKYAH